jgi:hypothetical protein
VRSCGVEQCEIIGYKSDTRMSQRDIIEKLREHLAGPVDTECKAVYLLCEVRKLLDRQLPDPMPFALRLYCHWAVHVDLSRPKTTMPFLEKVDEYIFDMLYAKRTNQTIVAEEALFREFVFLATFRKELSQFLASHQLPTSLCDKDSRWFTFLAAFAGVIEDGSLTCVSRDPDKLKIVKKVTFTKGREWRRDGHVPFTLKWDILLKDNRRLEVEVGTQANHELLHWGIRLPVAGA